MLPGFGGCSLDSESASLPSSPNHCSNDLSFKKDSEGVKEARLGGAKRKGGMEKERENGKEGAKRKERREEKNLRAGSERRKKEEKERRGGQMKEGKAERGEVDRKKGEAESNEVPCAKFFWG